METEKNYRLVPTFGNSFGTGFQVMLDNFNREIEYIFKTKVLDFYKGIPLNLNLTK